jgi:hypothetical protein
MSADSAKFLFLFRFSTDTSPRQASPDEMQAQYAAWTAWKSSFAGEVTPGDGLKNGGRVLRGGKVTDGPYIEAKEVLGSYAFVTAADMARAAAIALACPINSIPGASVEIRELGY